MGIFAESYFTTCGTLAVQEGLPPLKPKYYPHITILGATLLTIVPLCLVLTLPWLRGGAASDEASIADHPAAAGERDSSTTVATSSQTPAPSNRPVVAHVENPAVPSTDKKRASGAETRVAMLPSAEVTLGHIADTETEPIDRGPLTSGSSMTSSDGAVLSAADPVTDDEAVPVPEVLGTSPSRVEPPPSVPVHETKGSASSRVVAATSDSQDQKDTDNSAAAMVSSSPEAETEPLVEPYPMNTESAFEVTGHLSLTGRTTGAMAGTSKSMGPDQPTMAANSGKPSAQSRGRVNKTAKGADAGRKTDGDMNVTAENPFAPGFGIRSPETTEDVILQHPLENRHVARMENLIGVTRAQGWPIALVRSDLPDDFWWVQQMVGIRGNSFAARVNFGNEHSISGSVYHLVIVFLDSPEEVRRFRIAKQFKELPEGIRHSREFTFIRR